MKTRMFVVACAAIALASAVGAGTNSVHANWVGVWQGKLDGQPSVELTLADDAGDLGGTIVFHAIRKDDTGPHVFSTEPHTLMHPHVDGYKLSFEVKRGNGSAEILDMTVELGKGGKAEFRCSNCSEDGTRAELERAQ
jgi:hypothetical protein